MLVVAADSGVQPQTREVLELVRSAGDVSLVVALTKIDRDGVQVDDARHRVQAEPTTRAS